MLNVIWDIWEKLVSLIWKSNILKHNLKDETWVYKLIFHLINNCWCILPRDVQVQYRDSFGNRDLSHFSMMSGGLGIILSLNWSKYFISVSSGKRVWIEELNFVFSVLFEEWKQMKSSVSLFITLIRNQQLTKVIYETLPFYFLLLF